MVYKSSIEVFIMSLQKKPDVCFFVGHRKCSSCLYEPLVEKIGELIEMGVREFWVGGYGEFDLMAEKAVREWKRKGVKIKLVLVLAYPPKTSTDENWRRYLRQHYEKDYDETFLPDLEKVPYRQRIIRRNQLIARQTGHVISGVTRTYGNAYDTLCEAEKAGAMIHRL